MASTCYRQSDAGLSALKKDPELTWLAEVSSVPWGVGVAAPARRVLRVFCQAGP
jgi:hypothetical protein